MTEDRSDVPDRAGGSDRGGRGPRRDDGSARDPTVGEPVESDAESDDGSDGDGPSHAGVFGAAGSVERPAIDPGDPTLENALFVLLGVAFALAVVVRAATVFVG